MINTHDDGHLLAPSAWVMRFAPLVAAGRAVLDLAAGGGRHTRLFLERGHPVTALDREVAALRALESDATIVAADLEDGSPWPLGAQRFAGVVVTNYLHQPLFPTLLQALAPGGVLIYETFARGNEQFGRPRQPEYLLEPGELLARLGAALHVIAYEHGQVALPRPAVVQRLCAVLLPSAADAPAYPLRL